MIDPMKAKREALEKLNSELTAFQQKYTGDLIPSQAEAEAMDAKAEEALTLQKELDDYVKRSARLQQALNWKPAQGVAPLPTDDQPGTVAKGRPDEVAGYMTIGDYVIAQGNVQKWVDAGRPQMPFKLADVPTLIRPKGRTQPLVPLSQKQVTELYERKAVPTLGAGVIDPMRVPDIVKVTEFDTLRLRDVLNIATTTSNAVEWVRETSYTRAAEITAHGAEKPEAAKVFDLVSTPVRTIAVWMPVHDQQLEDWGQLQNLIETNLLYDVEKRLEEQIMWGDGIGLNFLGFFADPLIWACGQLNAAGATRVIGTDTLIDIIRRGITDVRVAGYSPNGTLVHPYDWEQIQLSKATTNQYIYVVVTEAGISRLWGVPVIETEACQDFTGAAIEERNLLVGDFTRGATLYDRMQAAVRIGWIDDQFIRNMRTLLAELRAAWAIRRPGAFRDYQTQAAVES